MVHKPNYIKLHEQGKLKERVDVLNERLKNCDLCPRKCKINRLSNAKGICNTGKLAVIASYGPHFGEESPLVGKKGSGTIFFSNCNLLCNFCQNFDISHEGIGTEVNDDQLSDVMLSLQNMGCHNINFVTPSHVVPQIVSGLYLAVQKGLNVPLIYNTSGYDDINTIRLLSEIIDIYMPDFKFMDSDFAELTCNAADYFEITKKNILEMHNQVGVLKMNEQGIAFSGILIRHLIMPKNKSDTEKILDFICSEISSDTFLNIMEQYRPEGRAYEIPEISKSLNYSDYIKAKKYAQNIGLKNLL